MIVTLKNFIAESVLFNKIKMEKLTISQFSQNLAQTIPLLILIDPVSFKINALLPKESCNLKMIVYEESKDNNNKCIAYTRDGYIYGRIVTR